MTDGIAHRSSRPRGGGLWWSLPLATIAWIVIAWAFGRLLAEHTAVAPPPRPIEARIVKLPPPKTAPKQGVLQPAPAPQATWHATEPVASPPVLPRKKSPPVAAMPKPEPRHAPEAVKRPPPQVPPPAHGNPEPAAVPIGPKPIPLSAPPPVPSTTATRPRSTAPKPSTPRPQRTAKSAPPPAKTRKTAVHSPRHTEKRVSKPKPKPTVRQPPRPAAPQPILNLAQLNSQIDSAAQGAADRGPPQPRDPNTLVATYYITAMLQKMEQVGNLTYPTDMIGTTALRLVVNAEGKLLSVGVEQSSGNTKLDGDAARIAREAAPFGPFPSALKAQTTRMAVVCYMKFEGYQDMRASR